MFVFFSPDFATLLGSGDLTEKSTMKCIPMDNSLDASLLRICFYNHFKGKTLGYCCMCTCTC